MASEDKGRPLPKFCEWDVNNPASAEGFTVIFNKARDEKKTSATTANTVSPLRNDAGLKNESYLNTLQRRSGFAVVEKIIPIF